MRSAAYILLFLCCSYSVGAQDPPSIPVKRQPFVQLNYLSGSFWSRSEFLQEQFSEPYRAIEARFGFQSTGTELWQQYHRYPRYGLGMHYSDLVKNPTDTTIGNPFSLFVFYSGPWVRFGRFTLATDIAVGLSYMGRIYDPIVNPFNDVIASHVNLYFDLNMSLGFSLSKRWDLYAGYGLTHYSNGRIHQPQKGVNNWGWTAGVSYLINEPLEEYIYQNPPEFQSSEWIQLMYGVGVVEEVDREDAERGYYFTSSFTADYAYQFSPKMALTLGMDVLYDGSLGLSVKGFPENEVSTWQKTYLASHLGWQYIIHRFRILMNFGTYFSQHSNDRGYWFIRAGGRIQLTDHLAAHICIKSKDGVRSDWIEWGLAANLQINKNLKP